MFNAMIKKEFLDIYRSRKFLILIILFAFIAISSPIIAKLLPTIMKSVPATPGLIINLPDPSWTDAIDQLVKNIGQIGMMVITIMFAGAIVDEKSKKTLEIVLTKPISRTKFILSKVFSSIVTTKVIFLVAMAVFYLYTVSLLGSFSLWNFFLLTIFLLVFLLVILTLSIFVSSFAKTQITSIGIIFFIEILSSVVFSYVKKISKYSPDYIVANYKNLMNGDGMHNFLPSLIVSIILIIVMILLSVYLFKKQEIER